MKIAVTLLIILFPISALSIAEGTEETHDTEITQAVSDAERDANLYDASSWGTGSCIVSSVCVGIGGIFVLTYAQFSEAKPPPERLLGKTPIYVTVYQSTYQEKVKRKRLKSATVGCVVGTTIAALIATKIASDMANQPADDLSVDYLADDLFDSCWGPFF